MAIQLKKDLNSIYSLPQAICNYCGHSQIVFAGVPCSCTKCFRYFPKEAFKISSTVINRLKYYQGVVIYENRT